MSETVPSGPVDRYGRDLSGFTQKQRNFLEEYPKDWNGRQACIRAGYSPASADDMFKQLRKSPKIAEAITDMLAKRESRTEVNRSWVLTKLVSTEREAARAVKAKENPASARLARLKALHLIGLHVDVNAFRGGFLGTPGEGGNPIWDLSRLNEEELDQLERLIAKITVARDDPGATAGNPDGEGPGADLSL